MLSLKIKRYRDSSIEFEQNKKLRYDTCDCDITSSDINIIRVHFFNHVLSQFIDDASNIVELYVGPIHTNMLENLALGSSLVSIDDIKEELSIYYSEKDGYYENKCIIKNCGVDIPPIYCLCYEHTEQWNMRLLYYIHKHECNECFMKRKSYCISALMKLHKSLNSDIANCILSFCDLTILFKCNGHMKPISYVCNLCPKKNNCCVIL
jgi:hypothetical protein